MRRAGYGLLGASWELLRRPVPPQRRGWLAFGWVIVILFLGQVVTGILLSFYYQPSPDLASESVKYVMRDVTWGWLLRGLHYWAGQAMIVAGLIQLVRVFVAGAYRGDGASHWWLGLLLMSLVLLFGFTGELLPWDAGAYWRISAALARVETVPWVGTELAAILRGGAEVTASTLSRTYSAHVMLLPWLAFILLVLDVWLLAARRRPGAGEAS